MDGLLVSKVPRSLESKTKIGGFEIADVLLIFVYLGLSNFVFGATALKPLMVWGITSLLGFVLYFAKRGKPDDYLPHLMQFHLAPTVLDAGGIDTKCPSFKVMGE